MNHRNAATILAPLAAQKTVRVFARVKAAAINAAADVKPHARAKKQQSRHFQPIKIYAIKRRFNASSFECPRPIGVAAFASRVRRQSSAADKR